MNPQVNHGLLELFKYAQSCPYEERSYWTTSREFVLDPKYMVPPPGIEPGSMDFQSTAMTTFAKAA